MTDGATETTLSGNFIGTTASGNSALGNGLDGVAIENADGNALIGCTIQDNPFVYYNVISGNGANLAPGDGADRQLQLGRVGPRMWG